MTQIFGNFINAFSSTYDSLEISFTPTSKPIKQRWRNNRLSANFVADYLSNFVPVDENDHKQERRLKELKGAVSYVANELLENAMKFNNFATGFKVRFGVYFVINSNVTVVISTTNSVEIEILDKFQNFIQTLLSTDPSDFYVMQVEKSAEEDNGDASGLGLITMMNDYSAELGWKFETLSEESQLVTVTTMAQILV